jgi:hypothetical protein
VLRSFLAGAGALALSSLACASAPTPDYRLSESVEAPSALKNELFAKYPDFLGVVFDLEKAVDPDMRRVRDDLERKPADHRNFDALHAVALAYFELNARAQGDLGGDLYLADSFRAAKVVAIPWRAYGEVSDAGLRDAILHFFEDAAFGGKPGAHETAPRLARIVDSLAKKESDPGRSARIEAIVRRIEAEAGTPPDGA